MPRPPSSGPTEVELQILSVLWREPQGTARQIHEAVSATRETNYSTTVKMLAVMLEKGLVVRDEATRPHRYRSAKSRAVTQRGIVKDLIQRVFDGSAGSLVLQALASKKASAEELDEIRRLIDQLEGGA